MASTTLSSQIYSSKDQIVTQIIEYLRTYLELENVELVKGSFLSFIVETLGALTSNLIFYESSVYNEFFLTKAKLNETIFNLAAFLGYNTQEANYSVANLLISVPFGFTDTDLTISIPSGFKFYAGDIPFVTYYSTSIRIINNSQVIITANESGKIYDIPVVIDTTAENEFRFVLPVRQYESVTNEFQIDGDLQPYQFTYLDVSIDGNVSSMIVKVRDPDGSSYTAYTEFSSTYLMSADDYGYVSRRTATGRRIYFGNGLIGFQPLPGSTVEITTQITQGSDGNVIANSINTGERLYVVDGSITKIVDYTITNISPASGGEDEESIEDIRSSAIANLTSLGRLVSEDDFVNADVVMPNSPITTSSRPVLKRSDVRTNEIQLYVNLSYGGSLVPMRNVYKSFPKTQTHISRGTKISFEDVDYYTLFDMDVDPILNNTAYYTYIMNSISQSPNLVRSYNPPSGQIYNIALNSLSVTRSETSARFQMSYTSTEDDYDLCSCNMEILSTGVLYDMTNVPESKIFILDFDNYTSLPSGEETYYFTIKNPSGDAVSKYSDNFTFRLSLNSFMMSNIALDSTSYDDSTSVVVYDIPAIKTSYYDSTSFVQADFEVQVLQSILTNMDFSRYRMLTDFVNLKFTSTTGNIRNMLLNKITKSAVIDIAALPPNPSVGDRYIVAECDLSNRQYKGKIAECISDSTGAVLITDIWDFVDPTSNDIVYTRNRGQKYIYTGKDWISPTYEIPLIISLEVFKDEAYEDSDVTLTNTIRSTLVDEFSSVFGSNVSLYRSQIIKAVQSIEGVSYCTLISPESDIFFNFELDELTEDQLLEYGPEFVYFDENSIEVKIL